MWVSSKKAAEILGVKYQTLKKSMQRAEKMGKNFCFIKSQICNFNYINGRGGASGKVLQIWIEDHLINDITTNNEQIESENINKGAKHEKNNNIEEYKKAGTEKISEIYRAHSNKDSRNHNQIQRRTLPRESENQGRNRFTDEKMSDCLFETGGRDSIYCREVRVPEKHSLTAPATLPLIATCSDKKRKEAFEKYHILKEWERAKGKLKGALFIEYINSKNICSIKITTNKLYDWQRAYKEGGLDALIDTRGRKKGERNSIKALGLEHFCEKLILAQRGRINISNIHRALNFYILTGALEGLESDEKAQSARANLPTLKDFLGKKDEVVSYQATMRYVSSYLASHRIAHELILYGEDGVVSRNLPALGKSNWAVDNINQIVEIDSSPLDLICDASLLARGFSVPAEIAQEWQKRYCVIALIDTYSGVCTMHIAESENSIGVRRAVAKYIRRYGKPHIIKGDNGKAFLSKATQEVLERLEIDYKRVRAYSGWLKPYVERNFKSVQHQFIEWLKGYIGHNISQRQAIEFFHSKKERRLAKGQKSNLRNLLAINELEARLDEYCEKVLANSYKEGYAGTPLELYNAKAHEAIAMSEMELSLRLAPLELRRVGKEGVSFEGMRYFSPSVFAHERVYIAQNLNNINELFLFDEEKRFLDIAHNLLGREVSVEEAKLSAQAFKHHLKANKRAIKEAREQSEEEMARLFSLVAKGLEAPAMPKEPNISSEVELLESSIARAKSIREGNIPEEMLNQLRKEEKEAKDYSFEAVVLKHGS